jgi:hypothetical protein
MTYTRTRLVVLGRVSVAMFALLACHGGAPTRNASSPAPSVPYHVRGQGIPDPAMPPVVTTPFVQSSRLIFVRGRVGATSGVFLLDTGAGLLVLNTGVIRPSRVVATTGIRESTGMVVAAPVFQVDTLVWGGVKMFDANASGMNLEAVGFARAVGLAPTDTLLGIIGLPQLAPFLTVLDFERKEVRIHRLDANGRPLSRPAKSAPSAVLPLHIIPAASPQAAYARIVVKNDTIPLLLDTGADINVFSAPASRRLGSHLLPEGGFSTSGGLGGRAVQTRLVRLNRFTLGPATYDTLPAMAYIYDVPNTRRISATEVEQGKLGMPFFLRHRQVALDARAGKLLVWW